MTFASNLTNGAGGRDASLDRSYSYDHVGRLNAAYTGSSSLAHTGQEGGTWGGEGPYAQIHSYDEWGNRTHREGWGGIYGPYTNDSPSFTNNRQTGLSYDAAGNLTNDGSQTYSYDARGQQTSASQGNLQQGYDADGLRLTKTENGVTTYYLRSSVLGGQVVVEIVNGGWDRGYVYLGGQLVALQDGGVYWVHQEPTTKGQRVVDAAGNLVSTIEVDPFGGETSRSSNSAFQPHKYTSYERDANGGDDAMMRRYGATQSRFSQPDPYDGSQDFGNPQSFNRYAYVQNDPVNQVDPSGLNMAPIGVGQVGDVTITVSWMDRIMDYFDAGSGGDFGWLSDGPGYGGGEDLGGGGGGGGGVHEAGQTPQDTKPVNPFPPPPTGCEDQLAKQFGDPNGNPGAIMRITNDIQTGGYRGYDPKIPASADPDLQHLYFFPHLSSPDGQKPTAAYVPGDFKYIGSRTNIAENGPLRMFYSSTRDVTVFAMHVNNFRSNNRVGNRFRIGETGGIGGRDPGNIHSHFAVHRGRGYNPATRVPFSNVFCK